MTLRRDRDLRDATGRDRLERLLQPLRHPGLVLPITSNVESITRARRESTSRASQAARLAIRFGWSTRRLGGRAATLTPTEMARIDEALAVTLALTF